MRDFTLDVYRLLLEVIKKRGYKFLNFGDYLAQQSELKKIRSHLDKAQSSNIKIQHQPICLLRHDVDRSPENALETALIEQELNIVGSYYFRIIPQSFDEPIIKKISSLGHEIGYHYEDVDLVLKSQESRTKNQNRVIDKKKLIDLAYESFCRNLELFGKNFKINTICMHGSPLSKYDNKIIWEKYNYKDLGILGEPYFDIDWNEFAYFTDTGRKWNGADFSVRDKVNSKYNFDFKSTDDIIYNIKDLPDKLMITVHPQRWNDKLLPWLNEYFSQNLKNVIKKYIYVNK